MKRNCTICVAKTKTLITSAVTAQLICAFVFAYACYWFPYAVAQLFLILVSEVTMATGGVDDPGGGEDQEMGNNVCFCSDYSLLRFSDYL